MRVSLAAFSILVTWFCSASSAWAQNPVGTITTLKGTAQIERAGKATQLQGPITLNAPGAMNIELNDRVATELDSSLVITLPGNTELSAIQQTILVFDRTPPPIRSRVNLLRGSLEVSVTPPSDLDFLTSNGDIHVVGTLFDITYTEGVVRPGYGGCQRYTDVAVRKGVVAVNNPANPAVVVEVPAGYQTTVACLQPPLSAGPIGIPGTSSAGRAAGAVGGLLGVPLPPPSSGAPVPVPALVQ